MTDPLPSRRLGRWWPLGWLVALVALAGWLMVAGAHGVQPGLSEPLDLPVPTATLRTFDGRSIALAELRGRPVVVNFWASWSEDVRTEAPVLAQAWPEYQARGVTFIGIALHEQWTGRDPDHNPATFARRAGLTYPIGHDRLGEIGALFAVTSVPETYFIAPSGRIVRRVIGPMDAATLRRGVEEILGGP